jgi:hypothetical protein
MSEVHLVVVPLVQVASLVPRFPSFSSVMCTFSDVNVTELLRNRTLSRLLLGSGVENIVLSN